jgi:Carbohydrate-selective porin, OprB family
VRNQNSSALRTLNDNLDIVPQLLPRDVNPTVIGAVILNLNTSFNGKDLLQTSLAFGNNAQDTISVVAPGTTPALPNLFPSGTNPGTYFNPGQYYWAGFPTNAFLYRLAYTFKPFKDLTITAGPQFYPSDVLDVNSYANAPASDFGSYFFINNPFIIPYSLNYAGGAGVAIQWNPGQGPFTLKGLYMASGANLAVRNTAGDGIGGGFLGDPRQGSIELQYAKSFGDGKNNFAVRLQYTNSLTYNVGANAIGLNTELTLGRLGIFGRFGYAWINSNAEFNPIPYSDIFPASELLGNNFRAMTFMGGIAYKDLLIPGSLLAVAAGAPFLTQGEQGCCGNAINNRDQVNLEALYRFPVTDNITITPIFSVIFNPNNSSANDTIYQGVLRTTFTF